MNAEHQYGSADTNTASSTQDDKGKRLSASSQPLVAGAAHPDLHAVDGISARSATDLSRPSARALGLHTQRRLIYPGKRAFDMFGAAFLGVLLSPLILIIVFMIRIEGEPVLFRHKRIGQNGRVFHCLKFRTMVHDAEQVLRDVLRDNPELLDEWIQNHKIRNDPRITPVGRFLRLTSLDELPQIWNILRGDMSLVGPRPVVREELLRYGRNVAHYLAVKPGLTGLWQVKGRSDTSYRRRVAMDTYYVRNQGIVLDLRIVAATTGAVWRRAGAY
jgi:lipopolysaccharide/colanic/teichoic acid biosynthesis glycosyltransferase